MKSKKELFRQFSEQLNEQMHDNTAKVLNIIFSPLNSLIAKTTNNRILGFFLAGLQAVTIAVTTGVMGLVILAEKIASFTIIPLIAFFKSMITKSGNQPLTTANTEILGTDRSMDADGKTGYKFPTGVQILVRPSQPTGTTTSVPFEDASSTSHSTRLHGTPSTRTI